MGLFGPSVPKHECCPRKCTKCPAYKAGVTEGNAQGFGAGFSAGKTAGKAEAQAAAARSSE